MNKKKYWKSNNSFTLQQWLNDQLHNSDNDSATKQLYYDINGLKYFEIKLFYPFVLELYKHDLDAYRVSVQDSSLKELGYQYDGITYDLDSIKHEIYEYGLTGILADIAFKLIEGYSMNEIADICDLTIRQVRTYRDDIRRVIAENNDNLLSNTSLGGRGEETRVGVCII